MANEKGNDKKDGATNGKGTGKDATATRKGLTVEQLQGMGKKGHLVLLARLAYAIGSSEKNKFSGTEWKGREAKKVAGTWYQKIGPNGPVLKLEENSDEIKNALSLAKLAQKDVSEQKWSPAVQKFLDSILSITTGGTGVRTRNFGIASDLKF